MMQRCIERHARVRNRWNHLDQMCGSRPLHAELLPDQIIPILGCLCEWQPVQFPRLERV
jgi:hypothetical protein